MEKLAPKMIVTSLENQPKVLIVGQKDILTTKVLRALEKKGCLVFIHEKLAPFPSKVDYIFQFSEFAKTRELLEKAEKENARYLLIEEGNLGERKRKKAEQEVFAFKERVDCRILRIGPVSFSNTPSVANQILKAMFGRKKALPPPLKFKEKKAERRRSQFVPPKFKIGIFIAAFFFSLFLLSPYLFFGANLFFGIKNLNLFKHRFLSGNLLKAQENATSAQEFFGQAKKTGSLLPLLKSGERIAYFGETLGRTGVSAVNVSKVGPKIARLVFGQDEGIVKERLDQLKVELDGLEREILLTKALYQDLGLENYQNTSTLSLGEKLKEISALLSSAEELCLSIKKGIPLADEVLGLNGSRVYLVLFQNNMELRPGGGFIGSYGLAHFERGVLAKLETYDVYTADGQLKGHVEPPAPLRIYLDQPHFFLRDSNFSPDFGVNGPKAAWFFKKELGAEVDGVIAVDLTFAQKLLESLGGIYLPDYQQEITAENLFLKAQAVVQTGFFPGSTQKRDFLGALSRGILNQVKLADNLPWLKIIRALKESLEEKHIQIFLFNERGQELAEEMGWGGRVGIANCKLQIANCFGDYLMGVEANLGVNKANYFVKREVGLETEFSQDKASHKLSISYQNTSPGMAFPGGVYKNYLRVFVPKDAGLKKTKIKGREIPIEQVEIEEGGEGKISWGVLVEINAQEKGKVEFEYDLDLKEILAAKQFSYELFFQKQAGTEKDPLFLKFNYPKTWQVKKTNFPAVIQNGGLNYDSILSVDRVFSVEFLK